MLDDKSLYSWFGPGTHMGLFARWGWNTDGYLTKALMKNVKTTSDREADRQDYKNHMAGSRVSLQKSYNKDMMILLKSLSDKSFENSWI